MEILKFTQIVLKLLIELHDPEVPRALENSVKVALINAHTHKYTKYICNSYIQWILKCQVHMKTLLYIIKMMTLHCLKRKR